MASDRIMTALRTPIASFESARLGVASAVALALASSSLIVASCKQSAPSLSAKPRITVAAAADLALAFRDVGAAFGRAGHEVPTFTFGSTGLLAQQVSQGAPFDVFAAANASFVDDVVSTGACDGSTKAAYARGRIVVFSAKHGRGQSPKTLADLASPSFARIAIANPDHAPYGRAAVQAMKSAGVYATLAPKLVFGENVQQALQFAQSGNADAAIVALSLALQADGVFAPIDASAHMPIDQTMVMCNAGPSPNNEVSVAKRNEARAFIEFVASSEGRAIMRRYGFLLPGEAASGDHMRSSTPIPSSPKPL